VDNENSIYDKNGSTTRSISLHETTLENCYIDSGNGSYEFKIDLSEPQGSRNKFIGPGTYKIMSSYFPLDPSECECNLEEVELLFSKEIEVKENNKNGFEISPVLPIITIIMIITILFSLLYFFMQRHSMKSKSEKSLE
jgi:hypothetical protein